MIKLELNDKLYDLPTSMKEVSIELYQKIVSIDKKLPDLDRYVKILSVITGISEEDIRKINMEQLKIIQNNIKFIFENGETYFIDRFEMDGIKYGFNNHLTDITFGEYIDLESISKPELINGNLHLIMATLYRPVEKFKRRNLLSYLKNDDKNYTIEKYDGDSVDDRAELFKKKLTMDIVLGSLVFFSLLRIATMYHTQGYSGKKLKKKVEEMSQKMFMKKVVTSG